jgi:hypothetical protein
MNVLDYHRQEPQPKMWQKCKRLFWKTEGKRFMIFMRLSNCHFKLSHELNILHIASGFVPGCWVMTNKSAALLSALSLRNTENDPSFIFTIVTGDEFWVYEYYSETKQGSSQWKMPNSPRSKKAWQVWNSVKSVLIYFFGTEDIVYKEFVPPGQTVNGISITMFWVDQGKTSCANILPSDTTLSGLCTMTIRLPTHHPLYGSFWLQWKLQSLPTLTTHSKNEIEDVLIALKRCRQNCRTRWRCWPKITYFHQCFQSWKSPLNHCISAEVDHFEGDGGK